MTERAATEGLTFGQQIILQLVGPVAAAVFGTLIIGGIAQVVSHQVQHRKADREVRSSLVSRLSKVAYSLHYRIQHYERWARHSSPPVNTLQSAQAEVERAFIEDRIELGALQNEVDAYFGKSGPGASVHRMTDLIMVRFMQTMSVPASQLAELSESVAGPGHTELSIDQLRDARLVQGHLAQALHESMDRILRDQIGEGRGFSSTKILTGPDAQRPGTDITDTHS